MVEIKMATNGLQLQFLRDGLVVINVGCLRKLWICVVAIWIFCGLSEGSNCFTGCKSDDYCNYNTSIDPFIGQILSGVNPTRPGLLQGRPTNVVCDIYINSFDSISVDTMDFSVNIYMRETWVDKRLAFSKLFPDLKRITLDHRVFDRIWVPDLFFPNEKAASTHCVTVPNSMIRISPNGTIMYSSRYTLTLSCHMRLRKYPFDKQECFMRIESYSYTLEEIELAWSEMDPVQTNENLTLPQFVLLAVDTQRCHMSYITGDFACLEIRFTLQRQYGYFMIQTYVPSILIVTLSWVAFWINIDAVPARISLGVLTVLTLTTQCVGVWMSLPRVSYVKAIDVWMSVCIVSVFAAMLEFALVNTLARKEIRRLSMRVRRTEKMENNSDLPSDMIKRMMDEYAYGVPQKYDPNSRMLARKVDKVSRWLFPFVFLGFNVAYWCIYLL